MCESPTYRNITYRLLPGDVATANKLLGTWDACRYAWNEVKEARELQYAHACGRQIESPTTFTLFNAFKVLWDSTDWLRDYSYAIVRYTLKYQADAWKSFFKGDSGYPKWKNKFGTPSITIPENVRIKDGRMAVPKVGWLALRRRGGNPYPDGAPVRAVIKRIGKRWYATVCYKVNALAKPDDGSAIGVDMNVRQVADSTGEIHQMPDLARLEAKHKRHQRGLARKTKGSKRRERAKRLVARAARRQGKARHNWQHHVTKRIAGMAHTVVIEDLNTEGMTRSAKGTKAKPGKNVRQKAGLNREILKTSWGALRQMLGYKAGAVVEINPAYTSQTCSACGVVDADSRRTQASFKCTACGHAQNADLNAARNILASGTGATARGGALPLGTPAKREMDTLGLRH